MIDSSEQTSIKPLTATQAHALAELLHQLRPEWLVKSMVTLMGNHQTYAPFEKLALAAVKCALDPKIKTPAMIFTDNAAWREPRQAPPVPPSGNDTSPDCENHPGVKAWACRECRVAAPRPASFRDMIEQAADAERARRLAEREAVA